ncbi:glycosyltransferase family 2 protein [Rhizobacter sp. P5_C2]
MKFSVLLPTRNRLEYLRHAVETVRRQDHDDWEIVVSDNCSEEDIAGYVRSIADPRIKYVRTDSFVPVTDNWNNALAHSSGDWVVMLGDDDGLMPGYFATLLRALDRFPEPDFVYTSALYYAYPGVMPDAPDGFLRRDHSSTFAETEPFWLDIRRAEAIARGYLDFRMPVGSNMQFSLISRKMIGELSKQGPFFRSPYPDFFATPALFLKSTRILIYPQPLVLIGITPKSYGFFHFNNRADDGVKFLKNNDQLADVSNVKAVLLPGTSYYDSWLMAMEALRTSHAAAHGLRPNYRRYRLLQIANGYKKCYFDRVLSEADLAPLCARMTIAEKAYGLALHIGFGLLRLAPAGLASRLIMRLRRLIGHNVIRNEAVTGRRFANLIEVFESMESTPRTQP